jgi:UDP-N-acetylglucosamine 2-epimerase (non-hydrolysing)
MSAKKNLTLVVGARPNFIKAAPLLNAIKALNWLPVRLIHTGQHFDENMSQVFFEQLRMPEPDAYLDVNTGEAAEQIAQVISALAVEFSQHPPEAVCLFGDVNSTLAAAVAANKMGLRLAHVEAGLRSFDRRMPEEHNRIVTDMLSDLLFTPSADADANLLKEGVTQERIFRVGNIMADSLLAFRPLAEKLETYRRFGLQKSEYGLVTLHRPSNVDEAGSLKEILSTLEEISKELPLLFPVHPRTRKKIDDLGPYSKKESGQIHLTDPLSYLDFLNLTMSARVVLTDSGGIQEETTLFGVACLTLRENTERPITITQGTNRLVGNTRQGIIDGFQAAMKEDGARAVLPELWDGNTGERIATILHQRLSR